MILVVGGTGNLGAALVPLLLDRGRTVRVMSRTESAVVPGGCEHLAGDVADSDALRRAVEGCDTVISAVHGFVGGRGAGPEEVDRDANIALIDSALRAGVRRFILVSVSAAAADHPMILMRMKFAAEERLRATDLAWTIIRPTAFLETWLAVVGAKVPDGGPALVLGRATNPINFVSARDVAAVIEHCIADPDTIGRVIDVAGPQNLTLLDLAAALGATRIRRVPRRLLAIMQRVAGPVAPARARQARMSLYLDTADMTATPSPEWLQPHRTVDTVIGRR